MPPLHEIAHLGHVELRTPVLEESVEFFTRYLGLTRTGEVGDSVLLRAWDDYETTTIKLTGHRTSGVGRTTLRAAGPEALARRVAEIEATGRAPAGPTATPATGPPTSSPTPTATSSACTTSPSGTPRRPSCGRR
ncbi:hypothetical protein [Modestobacter sp. I12A-02662]|uniref:hypothetical protein n=1 Tax=Modestobacter sp. I12A-02662 TaxID=1730496 RepID=UPI0034E05671